MYSSGLFLNSIFSSVWVCHSRIVEVIEKIILPISCISFQEVLLLSPSFFCFFFLLLDYTLALYSDVYADWSQKYFLGVTKFKC